MFFSIFAGGSVAVLIGFEFGYAVILATAVTVGYTLFAGLYAVTYTDALQILLIFVGFVRTSSVLGPTYHDS